jgi:hypothetical protein
VRRDRCQEEAKSLIHDFKLLNCVAVTFSLIRDFPAFFCLCFLAFIKRTRVAPRNARLIIFISLLPLANDVNSSIGNNNYALFAPFSLISSPFSAALLSKISTLASARLLSHFLRVNS